MSDYPISTSAIDDNRAVSSVIGVVILFGFLILVLSLYQVEVVPQQNAETEFQHSGEVRNDLVELRAGILQAGSIDQPQYQTVQLGTVYSTRVFSINPPAPAGTIRTSESYPITIAYESNGTVVETIPTRFIEYQPGYNELDRSPTWYDASLLYLDARDEGGGIAVIEDQNLVDSDGEVQITALQNEFRRSGTGQVTLELRPAESVIGDIPEADLNVTVPTRLSNEEYWNSTDISNNKYSVTDDANDDGIHNLTLETTTSSLTIDTVGVQEVPEEPVQSSSARIGGSTSQNKPPVVEDLIYQNDAVAYDGNDPDAVAGGVNFSVTNRVGEDVTITDVRVTPRNSDISDLSDDGLPNGEPVTSEVYVAADLADAYVDYDGGTVLPKTVDLDTDGFTNNGNAQLSDGATATFYLYEFIEGFFGSVDMSGEDVEITITYQPASGGTETKTFTITPNSGGSSSGGSDPVINSLSTRSPGQSGQYKVMYGVSDPDSDLAQIEFSLRDSSNNELDSISDSGISGGAAAGETDNLNPGGGTADYVRVTVTDESGNTAQQDVDI
ncbi:hypothetical protein PM025_15625 [Halorubrum ezzemoulense]|uniref:hypothetical protein n=1 Tax=Halorubrum ezzemoulense TaxID=337243 RepID=UPI00232BAA0F|nr:hypothetical protein [Halorubrum ezzemoulense]MDB2265537.1 hypothetical protein [Halorubrum ezzemoulense]